MKCFKIVFFFFLFSCGSSVVNEGKEDKFSGEVYEDIAPYIETELQKNVVSAGENVAVKCITYGLGNVKTEILVSGGSEVVVDGLNVKITKTGKYKVACKVSDSDLKDETPETLIVQPSSPWSVETKVSSNSLKAGENLSVECPVFDFYGNIVETKTSLMIKPGEGYLISGLLVQFKKVGTYKVSCLVIDYYIFDKTPEIIEVSVNVPKIIKTIVQPEKFVAGEKASVECIVEDYYGNQIYDFPLSIYIPSEITLMGKEITTTIAGIYKIQCVPQTIEWKYFELHPVMVTVLADKPVLLELKKVPDKPFYGLNDTLTVLYSVYDQYKNVVPDVKLAPVEIDPPSGIEPSAKDPVKIFFLNKEGIYTMTFRLFLYPEVSAELLIKVDGKGPLLTIDYPPRGATISGKPSITVKGKINDDVTGIKSFKINGKEVVNIKLDGSFTYIVNPKQGMNLLVFEAEDVAGYKVRTMRVFYFSFIFYPVSGENPDAGFIPKSILLFLSKDFIDDGVHDPSNPDDLATIMEMYLTNLNIASMIQNPVASQGNYKIYIKNITYGKPLVQLKPFDGGLNIYVEIPSLKTDVDLIGKCKVLGIDLCPDFSGVVKASKIIIYSNVYISMGENKKVNATLGNTNVEIKDIDVDINGIVGWLFDWLIDIIVGSFANDIEKAFESQLGDKLQDTMAKLFENFEISESFEIPPMFGVSEKTTLNIVTRLGDIKITSLGINLEMEGSIWTKKKISHDILGSISRSNCLKIGVEPFKLPSQSEMEVALFDDLINEGLYSVWYGGTLNIVIDEEVLKKQGQDLSKYGVSELNVKLDFFLPPILTSCNEKDQLVAQIGDLYIDADFKLYDIPIKINMFTSIESEAIIEIKDGENGEKEIGISIGDINIFEGEIIYINEELEPAKEIIFELVKTELLGKLVDSISGNALGSFPIPAIDMSKLNPNLPAGIELKLKIEDFLRDKGYIIIKGKL